MKIENRKRTRNYAKNRKNYRICRHVYQTLFYEIAETFIQNITVLLNH